MRCLQADSPHPRGSQELRSSSKSRLSYDPDLTALYLRIGLLGITSIREKNGAAFCDQQRARAARESAEIMDIGKVSDEKPVQFLVTQSSP
jgi:hypothetical protein